MVRTPFAALAEAFEKLEATTSSLKMIDMLADLLAYIDNGNDKYDLPPFFPCLATNSGLKLSDRQARRIMGGLRDGRDRVKNDLTNGKPQDITPQFARCSSSGEKPPFWCGAAKDPAPALHGEERHLVAVQRQRLGVAAVLLDHRPIGPPHQALDAELAVKPLHLIVSVFVGVFLLGPGPEVADLDVDPRVLCQRQQLLQVVGLVDWAIRHVIDADVRGAHSRSRL
jgi:hypothetical protein